MLRSLSAFRPERKGGSVDWGWQGISELRQVEVIVECNLIRGGRQDVIRAATWHPEVNCHTVCDRCGAISAEFRG